PWNDIYRRLHRQRTPQSLAGVERANLRRHCIRSREENREAWRHHHHPGRRGARMARHPRARGLSELPAVAGHSHRGLGAPAAQEVMASNAVAVWNLREFPRMWLLKSLIGLVFVEFLGFPYFVCYIIHIYFVF